MYEDNALRSIGKSGGLDLGTAIRMLLGLPLATDDYTVVMAVRLLALGDDRADELASLTRHATWKAQRLPDRLTRSSPRTLADGDAETAKSRLIQREGGAAPRSGTSA
ncbi:MAG TPA: hypothetical protein VFF73_02555 [Planctomycetota bacterium]|nr:hypothetical protein [Planctomycetota bacterium]